MQCRENPEMEYRLNQIYFYLTRGCNLRCRHCWIAPKFHHAEGSCPALDLDLFRSIIRQAKPLGLSGVKLTGGEPLLHPDIHEILKLTRSEGLRLVVETNGVLCTRQLAEEIAGCKEPFVSVSLDGADAATHEWVRGVEGSFALAVEGIKNLVAAGLRPQVIMSIMKRNKGQIEPVVRLAEELGAGSVKFNIVSPTARGERMHESGETLPIEDLVALGKSVQNGLSESTSLDLYYDQPAAFQSLGKILGGNRTGWSTCDILGIIGVLADGAYALCGIGDTVPELVFGNAASDSLEDVWKQAPVLKELREGLSDRLEGICGACLMQEICLGSCIAQNYYQSKSLWAPFWYCDQAERAGLFPESRKKPMRHVQ